MDIFDYMNLVSGYIINKMENKRDMESNIEFSIKTSKDLNDGSLYYVVEENNGMADQTFYIKFPCNAKQEFYQALNDLLIKYFGNSNLLSYTAIKNDVTKNQAFSMVSKNGATVSIEIEDEIDAAMYLEFQKYLDEVIAKLLCDELSNEKDLETSDIFLEDEIYDEEVVDEGIHTLEKIML